MKKHIVRVISTEFLTHNVKRFRVEKPGEYSFLPGQATDVAINSPELCNELRPFTFTSHPDDTYIEFIIKIYKGHAGITEKMLHAKPGDQWIIHEVFGSLIYSAPGVFIAGGAGITPFLSIFRDLERRNLLQGNSLVFANYSSADIICSQELQNMLGNNLVNILEVDPLNYTGEKYITAGHIQQKMSGIQDMFYLCGPDKFMEHCISLLRQLHIPLNKITMES